MISTLLKDYIQKRRGELASSLLNITCYQNWYQFLYHYVSFLFIPILWIFLLNFFFTNLIKQITPTFSFFTKWISIFFSIGTCNRIILHNRKLRVWAIPEYWRFVKWWWSDRKICCKYWFLFNRLQGKSNQLPSIKSSYCKLNCIMKYYFLCFLRHWIKIRK